MPVVMKSGDGDICDRCRVNIDFEGNAVAIYRWKSLDVDGRDVLDEDVTDWSDDEIRDVVAGVIGIIEGKEAIEIVWE